jgi:DNA-directed RNA polymerase specialized sigma24 family protein
MKTGDTTRKFIGASKRAYFKKDEKITEGEDFNHYRPLLYTISVRLGLSEKDAFSIVEEICVPGKKSFEDQKEGLSTRLWLSRLTVRRCIFIISSRLFRQIGNGRETAMDLGYIPVSTALQKLPLSYRTIFTLIHCIGFTEKETAQLLNITPIQVKERLAKALSRMASLQASN